MVSFSALALTRIFKMSNHTVFHPVTKSEELIENKGEPFTVDGERIMVVRHGGSLYALDDLCPHADASMAFGLVENGCIACPWHYAQFELKTGDVLSGPATSGIRTHQVRERDGMVEVSLTVSEEK